jgi:hypothetical protein
LTKLDFSCFQFELPADVAATKQFKLQGVAQRSSIATVLIGQENTYSEIPRQCDQEPLP